MQDSCTSYGEGHILQAVIALNILFLSRTQDNLDVYFRKGHITPMHSKVGKVVVEGIAMD